MKVLSSDSLPKVVISDDKEIEFYMAIIKDKYPLLDCVYAVAEGLKLHLEQAGEAVIQNMFYNGWKHDHNVGNVLVFSPSGLTIACTINAPGAMHDLKICDWGGLYEKMEDIYERTKGKAVVDSAFSRGNFDYLIKSSQDDSSAAEPMEVMRLRQATSLRQSGEWGMSAFQGSFPRLKDRFFMRRMANGRWYS